MKTLASISRYIDATSTRLDDLSSRARTVTDGGRPIVQESLLHLASTLEELRVSEEELRAQAEGLAFSREGVECELRRYRELFDGAPDAYVVLDTHGVIRQANRAAGALLGMRAESLEGKPLAVFVPEEDRREFRRRLPWVRETERMEGWEVRLAPRGAEPVRVELTATPYRGTAGVVDELRVTLRPVPRARAAAAPALATAAEPERVERTGEEAEAWGRALLARLRGSASPGARGASDELCGAIRASLSDALYLGSVRPGDRVPGIREVGRVTGLNHKVVARAYQTLVEEGALEVRDRSGVYVRRQEWRDGDATADAAWLAGVLAETWRRGMPVAALPELLRRSAAGTRLRCACVDSDAARRLALCAELEEPFGLECVPLDPEALADDAALAREMERTDLVVTTPFHAGRVRTLARALGRPLLVVGAHPRPADGGRPPLPRLTPESARSVSETLVMLNLERARPGEAAGVTAMAG